MTMSAGHVLGSASRLKVVSADDLRLLDETALTILGDVGVAFPSAGARRALAHAGASVDGSVVKLAPAVVRSLLARAPTHITLGARAGEVLETGSRALLTTDGCCVEIYDLRSGEKRATVAEDVAAIARLVDAVPEIDFCWPAVSAQDVPGDRRGLHELYLALANTGKHVQTVTIVEPESAEVAVRMARIVAGGDEKTRREPPISALLGTVTPLGTDAGTLDAGLTFAAAGIPVGFVTMPMGGSTTPITMAGSLAVGIAEALAGVCAIQAAHPGAPVFISFIPSIMDLRTGDFTGGAPEDTIMAAAVADIGDYYGLPTQCGVNSSGAKAPGWQSALDDATTTLLSLVCGVDMLTGVGMVAGGRIFSFEEMLLATEIMARARRFAAGLDVGRLRGAASVSQQAGAVSHDGGVSPRSGGDAAEIARVRADARAILARHEPPALDASADAELRRLVGFES